MNVSRASAGLLPLCLLLTACAMAPRHGDPPEQHNKQVAARVFAEILSGGHFERAADLYSPGFINHGLHEQIGLAEDQQAARGWKQAFPDLAITPEKMIAEGDLVTIYWIFRGTNTGSGNGLPATGRRLETTGITIWRIVDGRITDEWSAFDQLGLMQQLGLLSGGGVGQDR